MNDIPLAPTSIESVLMKRKDTFKLQCVLCERKIGWFNTRSIHNFFKENNGHCICMICRRELQNTPIGMFTPI